MLVAKKKEVRRLLAVMLRTMPKLLEVVVVSASAALLPSARA